ncbi:MAG: hypothetical protein WBC06_17290, partial [Chitinophagaceae bacterium]
QLTGNITPQAANDGVLGTDANGRYIGPGSFFSTAGDNVNMAPIPVNLPTTVAGNSQPISIMQPYLGMNFIFCVEGIFPSRD